MRLDKHQVWKHKKESRQGLGQLTRSRLAIYVLHRLYVRNPGGRWLLLTCRAAPRKKLRHVTAAQVKRLVLLIWQALHDRRPNALRTTIGYAERDFVNEWAVIVFDRIFGQHFPVASVLNRLRT